MWQFGGLKVVRLQQQLQKAMATERMGGYPGSQPPFKKWWFLLEDDKPYYKKWWFGNQPIKNGGWTSRGYLKSHESIAESDLEPNTPETF